MIDWAALINKVPEVAMVVAVIWYSLELTRGQRASNKAIMAEWRQWLTDEGNRNRAINAATAKAIEANTARLVQISSQIQSKEKTVPRRIAEGK